jgi:hypothetical protein
MDNTENFERFAGGIVNNEVVGAHREEADRLIRQVSSKMPKVRPVGQSFARLHDLIFQALCCFEVG